MHLEVKIPKVGTKKAFKDKQQINKLCLLFLELVMHKLRCSQQI